MLHIYDRHQNATMQLPLKANPMLFARVESAPEHPPFIPILCMDLPDDTREDETLQAAAASTHLHAARLPLQFEPGGSTDTIIDSGAVRSLMTLSALKELY